VSFALPLKKILEGFIGGPFLRNFFVGGYSRFLTLWEYFSLKKTFGLYRALGKGGNSPPLWF